MSKSNYFLETNSILETKDERVIKVFIWVLSQIQNELRLFNFDVKSCQNEVQRSYLIAAIKSKIYLENAIVTKDFITFVGTYTKPYKKLLKNLVSFDSLLLSIYRRKYIDSNACFKWLLILTSKGIDECRIIANDILSWEDLDATKKYIERLGIDWRKFVS